MQLPGPGSYNDHDYEGINKFGTFSNTKHKNSLAPNFLKGDRKTFMDDAEKYSVKSHVPGPGTYKNELRISKERNPINDQQFATSEFKNTRTTAFGKYSERFEDSDYKGSAT